MFSFFNVHYILKLFLMTWHSPLMPIKRYRLVLKFVNYNSLSLTVKYWDFSNVHFMHFCCHLWMCQKLCSLPILCCILFLILVHSSKRCSTFRNHIFGFCFSFAILAVYVSTVQSLMQKFSISYFFQIVSAQCCSKNILSDIL